jgi:hypothetical protein
MEYNHKNPDFIQALGLNKDELFDIGRIGFEMHVLNLRPVSECIMVESMKNDKSTELKIFAAGMIFSQVMIALKDKEASKDLMKSIVKVHASSKSNLPFTTEDLMKSIRDEMDGQN